MALWFQLSVKLAHLNIVMISLLIVTPCPSFQLPVYTLHTTQKSSSIPWALKTNAPSSFKVLVTICQLKRCLNKEDLNLNNCHWKNLKYCQLDKLELYHQAHNTRYQCYNMLPWADAYSCALPWVSKHCTKFPS